MVALFGCGGFVNVVVKIIRASDGQETGNKY